MIILFALLYVIVTTSEVGAWGEEGHRGIAEAVQGHLTASTAKSIAKIVGTGKDLPPGTLARLSVWPDQIRALTKNPHATIPGFSPAEMEEAKQFVAIHPDNTNWHFVDLPPGVAHYPDLAHPDPADPALPFTNTTDVVHMIHQSVDILEGRTDSAPFTKLQALRWLLHLSEDIHQPLHVASGYYSTAADTLSHPTMLTDPSEVTKQHGKNDRGGNVLLFLADPTCPTKPTHENLHAIWDDCLVDVVGGANGCVSKTTDKTVARVADHLKTRMQDPASQAFRLQGDYHHWPEQWATDSVHVAAAGIFPAELDSGCVILDSKRPHPPVHVQSRVVAPATKGAYLQEHKVDADMQLTKAAIRLADLLNHMQWKE
ncbi:MAG TPA: S1/P1 nuclease [Nitrospira sp.]|nr:S1/P1 nuclease [Nitrospira sp.]